MAIMLFFIVGCCSGFFLFRRAVIPRLGTAERPPRAADKLSVIIPARNEERNLPHLLASLAAQTCPPGEIIVADDGSKDNTRSIAESFGAKVIACPPPPKGWTGKNWAVWNGYRQAKGELLAFFDADLRLAPQALEHLLAAREKTGGAVSVVPCHRTESWHERLALVTNVLAVFTFTSPFEKRNPRQGLYGSCIIVHRRDYEAVGGHESVRSEVLDDLKLGARFRKAGIRVTNYLGTDLVAFRMYPNGLKSQLEGFAKSAAESTASLHIMTVLLNALWLIGLIASCGVFFLWHTPWAYPFAFGYLLYALQLYGMVKYAGHFGKMMPLFHVFSTLFFLVMYMYSVYQAAVLGHVAWKGRTVKVGGGKHR